MRAPSRRQSRALAESDHQATEAPLALTLAATTPWALGGLHCGDSVATSTLAEYLFAILSDW